MTALAVADRPGIRDLIMRQEITVDYLETTGPLVDGAVAALPEAQFLLHNSVWNWSLAQPDAIYQQKMLSITLSRIEQLKVPWLSVHLGFSAAQVQFKGVMQPVSPILGRDDLFKSVCDTLMQLAAALPVPLIIENLDYNAGGAYEYLCEPAFIAEVLEAADVGFLLDLAHARVSAARLGFTIEAYLELLPLERVRQLHISGPRWLEGSLTDAHESLQEEDYRLLETVLKQTHPLALTLEYERDEATLKRELAHLRTLL